MRALDRIGRRPWMVVALCAGLCVSGATVFAGPAEASLVQRAQTEGSGWIGINLTEFRHAFETPTGVRFESHFVVDAVEQNSDAARVGIRAGDELIALDGRQVTTGLLSGIGASLTPGQVVTIEVRRDGESRSFSVRAGVRPAHRVARRVPAPEAVVWQPSEEAVTKVRAPGRELVITFRTRASGDRGWTYTVEPDVEGVAFDTYAFASDLDSVLVSVDGLTRNLEVLRLARLDALQDMQSVTGEVTRTSAEIAQASAELEERLRVARDELAVISRRAAAVEANRTDSVYRVRIPRAGALSPYLRVRPYFLGALIQDIAPDVAPNLSVAEGVLVIDVARDTPAAEAGLEPGDVIVEINGHHVHGRLDLARALAAHADGVQRVTVVRRGQRVNLEVSQ